MTISYTLYWLCVSFSQLTGNISILIGISLSHCFQNCTYYSFYVMCFSHFLNDRLFCFQFFISTTSIFVYICFYGIPQSRFAGSKICVIMISSQICFQNDCNTTFPMALGEDTLLSGSPPVINIIALFDILVSSLKGIKWNPAVPLICISMTLSEFLGLFTWCYIYLRSIDLVYWIYISNNY